MKKLMLVLAAALLWAAPAQAKELLGVQLCGPDGCQTQRSTTMLGGPGGDGPFGGESVAPAKPGAWYRGFMLAGDGGKVMGKLPFYYVPDAHEIVQPGRFGQTTTWQQANGRIGEMVEALAARVRPYPVPHVRSVTLNGKAVQDPQSYLRLWTVGSKSNGYPTGNGDPTGTNSNQVVFYTDRPTPWSDGNYMVAYANSNILLRDGQVVTIPGSISGRLAQGASLDVHGRSPWLLAAAGLIALLALAAVARVVGPRLRAAPKPAPTS